MLHKAWNSKGEMPYCFPRSSIKFQGHTVQNITDFPDYRPVAAVKSLRFALFSFIYLFFIFVFIDILVSCRYPKILHVYRVPHTLANAADTGVTRDFWLARPCWNNMTQLSWHAKYPNSLQIYGWVICFPINCALKQMPHRINFVHWS